MHLTGRGISTKMGNINVEKITDQLYKCEQFSLTLRWC